MTFLRAYGTSEGVTKGNLKRGKNPYGPESKNNYATWTKLPKFTPMPEVRKVAQSLGLNPDWRRAPGSWTSQRETMGGIIAIPPKDASDVAKQFHELGHEYWNVKMSSEGHEASKRLLQWARTLPVYGVAEGVQNPDRRFRVMTNGEVINVQHGDARAHEELFTQLFSLHYRGKLGGDIETAFRMLMKMRGK